MGRGCATTWLPMSACGGRNIPPSNLRRSEVVSNQLIQLCVLRRPLGRMSFAAASTLAGRLSAG